MSLSGLAAPVWHRLTMAGGTVIFFIFCSLPGLLLSLHSVRAPWTMFRLSRSNLALQSNYIATFVVDASAYRAEHLGSELVYAALLKLTAWPPGALAIVPLGAFVLPLAYYAVAFHLSGSRITATGIAVFSGWYYPRLYSQYGLQAYVWTNILFLGFLLVFRLWLTQRTVLLSILLMVIFTGTFLHYHATPIWLIAMLILAAILQNLRRDRVSDGVPRASWSLPAFCLVVYLAFDTVFYGNVLARLRDEALGESLLRSVISRVLVPLGSSSSPELPPFVTTPLNPILATRTTLVVMVLLLALVLCWVALKSNRGIRMRSLTPLIGRADDVFIWAIIGAALTHALLYSVYGALSLRVVPLAFPLLVPLIARDLPLPRRTDAIIAVVLAGLAILGFISFASNLNPDLDSSELGLAAKLLETDDRILADAGVYDSVLLRATDNNTVVNFTWLSSDTYEALTDPNGILPSNFDFLFADRTGRPVIALNWQSFEPWTQHLTEIASNPRLNKIYESEKLNVFQPSNASLPDYRMRSEDVARNNRFLVLDSFRLFAANILILFMPGFALVFLLQKQVNRQLDEPIVAVGLSLAISVAIITFLGYLTNFTPLGLRWLPPLIGFTAFLLLAVSLFIKRQLPSIGKKGHFFALSIGALVLMWSMLAAWAADVRIEQRAKMIEFFVTEGDVRGQLVANAVNNSDRRHNYSVVVQAVRRTAVVQAVRRTAVVQAVRRTALEEAGTYRSEEIKLAPHEMTSITIPLDVRIESGRIDLTLVQDGEPISQLWISSTTLKQE